MPEHNLRSERMSKLMKKQKQNLKEKLDFRLQFHATRLPQTGWDRLVVSLIPVDNGRTSSKTQKAAYVRNGNCQWPDAVIESAMFSVNQKSMDYEEKLYRVVVSTALFRTAVLGEVTVNLANFASANSPTAVALPLKNCSYGTVLHIKIQCLTPITSSREIQREIGLEYADEFSEVDNDLNFPGSEQHNELHTFLEDTSALKLTSSNDSGLSEVSSISSTGLNGSDQLSVSGDDSSSTSSVIGLSDSQDQNEGNRIGSQDLKSPLSSYRRTSRTLATEPIKNQNLHNKTDQTNISATDGIAKNYSLLNGSRGPFQNDIRTTNAYFRADMDAVEKTINGLCLEAKKWETNLQDCNTDVEKQQPFEHVKQAAIRTAEISALVAERDSINAELQQIKYEKQVLESKDNGNVKGEAEECRKTIEQLNEEIAFEKGKNLELSLQLQKFQDSNVELVSDIQKLEDSFEKQHKEMEKLLLKNSQLESSLQEARYQQQLTQAAVERDWTAKAHVLEEHINVLETKLLAYELDYSVDRHLDLKGELPTSQPTVENSLQEKAELEHDTKECTHENMELLLNLNNAEQQQVASKTVMIDRLHENLQMRLLQSSDTPPDADSLIATGEGNLESVTKSNSLIHIVARMKSEIANLERENAALRQEKEQMQCVINNLQEQKADSAEQIKDLVSKVTHAEKCRLGLESKLQDLQEKERITMSRFEQLALQFSVFAEQTECTILSKQNLEGVIAQAEQGKTALQQALEISQEEGRLAKNSADSLAKDLAALRAQLHIEAEVKGDLQRRIYQLGVARNHLQDKVASLEYKNLQLLESNAELHDDTTKNKETTSLNKDSIKSLISELERGKMELEKECCMLKEANIELELQTGKLHYQVTIQEEHIKLLQRLNSKMEESVKIWRKDLSAANAEESSLNSELKYFENDFDDREKNFAGELETLKLSRLDEVKTALKAMEAQSDKRAVVLSEEKSLHMVALSVTQQNSKHQETYGMRAFQPQSISESAEFQKKVMLMEDEIRLKALEIESLKEDFIQKEMALCEKIEYLEMANEQLAEGQEDSGLEQLQNELTRLHNQNALLLRREQELISKLSTQELLQSELRRLQEENEQLDCKLSKFLEIMDLGDPLERITQLEIELADSLEVNNMYKFQLQSAFGEQHNVHIAALQNMGDADQVISNFLSLKKQKMALEEELREMRDRYFSMSLKYAEVEAQREELVFKIRTLRNGQKK